ncbi:MAG: protein kinase [Muribaculaceae bacterium]|nr:protein kinase [Muribaculaceae bacterium]MDE6553027.1 protein kinase [Muribaculaceae bacterium]
MMETAQGLKPGTTLRHETYRIEKILGQGGFGITYLAFDLNLERYVAIKEFFPKDYCDREETTSHVTLGTQNSSDFVGKLKAKFLKEARNIAKFDHPGIIKIHAAFEENNTAYYVMDYVEGQNLSEAIKTNGPLKEGKALEYVRKVGNALEYVHSRSINHLDVKPANILIRKSDDSPILIDFGLSKQYDSAGHQTSTTPTGISHGYAPAEQYNDGGVKEFSPQTDIYSLAATLYYALSGIVPPQAPKLIEDDLAFPASIPVRLIGTISKAMSPRRRDRQGSVSEFIDDLDKAKVDSDRTIFVLPDEKPKPKPKPAPNPKPSIEIVHKKTAPTSAKKRKPKSKLPLWIWIGSLLVLVGFVVGGVLWYNKIQGRQHFDDSDPENVTAKNFFVDTPLGGANYEGGVIKDPHIQGKYNPDGKGKAEIIDGEFKGCVYEGEFVDGTMEGKATYTLANGDVFEGNFKANQFSDGKYTVKENGEYFEGSFKNMEPYHGAWKDKNGKILEKL